MGAILLQEGELNTTNPSKPCLHPIAYYSATFTSTERNYNIYERELLAIIKAITHWRPYLIWMQEPFTIVTDHANLLYWKSPRKLNRQTTRWHVELQDYHFTLQHTPGNLHTAADALSRPPGPDEGKEDNQEITMIPKSTFIRIMDEDSSGTLEDQIMKTQNRYQQAMTILQKQNLIYPTSTTTGTFWKDKAQNHLIIPKDEELRRQVIDTWHNNPTGRHPGRDETT